MNNNNLHLESSPYLLQHAQNPVHWQAWSDEAFEQAKKQNKLVLISIGYSACHWCHVMEHECFEDFEVKPEPGKLIIFSNSQYLHYVSKVEGDERFVLSFWYNSLNK